jgi:hypothetical protein
MKVVAGGKKKFIKYKIRNRQEKSSTRRPLECGIDPAGVFPLHFLLPHH